VYAVAAIPEPFQILGLKLRPFTLDHYDILRRFDCAFVQEEAGEASRGDLLLGVLICSMEPEEFLESIESKTFERRVIAWGKKAGLFDFKEKAELFQKYLKSGWKEPLHINLKGGNATGDWSQNVRITLMARMNYTLEDFASIPMSKALADYYKLAESDGVIQLLSEKDMAEAQANADAMAKLEAMLAGRAT
jgi:hypothetical protein